MCCWTFWRWREGPINPTQWHFNDHVEVVFAELALETFSVKNFQDMLFARQEELTPSAHYMLWHVRTLTHKGLINNFPAKHKLPPSGLGPNRCVEQILKKTIQSRLIS